MLEDIIIRNVDDNTGGLLGLWCLDVMTSQEHCDLLGTEIASYYVWLSTFLPW